MTWQGGRGERWTAEARQAGRPAGRGEPLGGRPRRAQRAAARSRCLPTTALPAERGPQRRSPDGQPPCRQTACAGLPPPLRCVAPFLRRSASKRRLHWLPLTAGVTRGGGKRVLTASDPDSPPRQMSRFHPEGPEGHGGRPLHALRYARLRAPSQGRRRRVGEGRGDPPNRLRPDLAAPRRRQPAPAGANRKVRSEARTGANRRRPAAAAPNQFAPASAAAWRPARPAAMPAAMRCGPRSRRRPCRHLALHRGTAVSSNDPEPQHAGRGLGVCDDEVLGGKERHLAPSRAGGERQGETGYQILAQCKF